MERVKILLYKTKTTRAKKNKKGKSIDLNTTGERLNLSNTQRARWLTVQNTPLTGKRKVQL